VTGEHEAATIAADITFIGHLCIDEVHPSRGEARVAPGSAVLCGALAAARIGCRTAVIARLHPSDERLLQPLREAGVECVAVPAPETSRMEVVHPIPDLDEREMRLKQNAGFFAPGEIPAITGRFVHLAGISDREFTLPFMEAMKSRGLSLSADLQNIVRQVDPETRAVSFRDAPDKRRVVALMDRVKLDVVEAELLAGERDLDTAARRVASWGCPEVVITRADGVLAWVRGQVWFERFTNANSSGRTGRGDTTFAGYMAWRLDHPADEALRFASALVSIKMETPGPFAGTLADVLKRMRATRRDGPGPAWPPATAGRVPRTAR
jgi:sugar/nucleoside kinase (ribokinase family)